MDTLFPPLQNLCFRSVVLPTVYKRVINKVVEKKEESRLVCPCRMILFFFLVRYNRRVRRPCRMIPANTACGRMAAWEAKVATCRRARGRLCRLSRNLPKPMAAMDGQDASNDKSSS